MLDRLFAGLYESTAGITPEAFLWCIGSALVLGVVMALCYMFRTPHTHSFVVTLALLPAVVSVVIMMVSGNLGAGVAVAGTFSLVRFRSVPGTAKEICAVFLSMALGLACGMGYPGFAALFAVLMCAVMTVYTLLDFGGRKTCLDKILKITVPEDLDYTGAFQDILEQYTRQATLIGVRTTNLGSLNKLTYRVCLKSADVEKALIDALRCRNGNLEISLSLESTEVRDL